MKTFTIISWFFTNFILYGNSIPVDESTPVATQSFPELLEYIKVFDELDGKHSNNYEDLSWLNQDENDTELLNLQTDQPFAIGDHVALILYVKENPDTEYLLNLENVKDAPININHPTKILIHGWQTKGNNSISIDVKNIFFAAGNYNVIIVDYEKYAFQNYPVACIKARKVGAYIGQVLVSLDKQNKIRLEDVHVFGMSLGGHVSGFVGKTVKAQAGKQIGRITGLDPAGPVFEIPVLLEAKKRLDADDALFTDIIHTCGGAYGFRRALGHADFFPNSGLPIQPGCGEDITPIGCSHIMACVFYSESINSAKFLATPCSSWKDFKQGKCDGSERVTMGHYLNTTKAKGNYYLYTNEISPHALG